MQLYVCCGLNVSAKADWALGNNLFETIYLNGKCIEISSEN